MLLYTAELKHPRSLPSAEKRRRVAQLIEQLGLGRCANTTIGSILHRWADFDQGFGVPPMV